MKGFIRSALLFMLFSLVFYVFALFLGDILLPTGLKPNVYYEKGSSGHMFSRIQELKKTGDVDILVLGSSHAYRGFDPRIFRNELSKDLKFFNLGSSSQTPIQTEVLLTRHLGKLNPGIIIYEVYPNIFLSDGVESSLDIISNDRNDIHSFLMTLKVNNIKTWNTLIVGYIRDLLNIDASFAEPEKKNGDTYIPGGYVQKDTGSKIDMTFVKVKGEFNKEQINAFERCLSMIKEKNIRLILVSAPVTSSLYNSYSNAGEFKKMMSTAKEYYNFNEIMKMDDSLHFYDAHHLNQNGVEKFNRQFISTVLK
jgi:hypothetical protein